MLACIPSDLVILITSMKPKQLFLFYYGIFPQLLLAVDVAAENGIVEKPKHQPFGFHWFISVLCHDLMLIVGHQDEHSSCKNRVMKRWHGYLSGARCR